MNKSLARRHGTLLARAAHEVVFSHARSEQMLKRLGREAQGSVHWSRVDGVLVQAGDLSGAVILSCSLPMNAHNTENWRTGSSGFGNRMAALGRAAAARETGTESPLLAVM